ncbi:MAG: SGNH/GDSL hydrolase family protein [Acidobacteriaceae bacterium]
MFPRRLLSLFSALVLIFSAFLAQGQDCTHLVIFGDSLSDTGNLAHLTQEKYGVRIPGALVNYADGRATDGVETIPAAQKYFGLWVEQLAALLPAKPIITDSLDGGSDYAYGYATTGNGTTVVSPTPAFSVTVNNMGRQISDYLATSPVISHRDLFVVWGGANDILGATSVNDVVQAAVNVTNDIQRLINAGGTQFIIPNQPPLGLVPELNGNLKDRITANAASLLFNQLLSAGLALLEESNRGKHLNFMQLDVFGLFYKIVASPASFGLANVTAASQGVYTVDPDTYLFWDDLHPTTKGHNILAEATAAILSSSGARH